VIDFTPPFNKLLHYTARLDRENDTTTATLPWGTGVTSPAFSTIGQFPLLRAPRDKSLGQFRVPIIDYSATFGLRAITHHIIGSAYPVVSSDVTELKAGVMTWATGDPDTRRAMLNMVDTTGHVLHLRAPCIAGALDDLFFVVTSLSETAPNKGTPQYREWSVGFQQVIAPPESEWEVPPVDDRMTWGALADTGNTWGDVMDTYANWFELEIASVSVPRAHAVSVPYVGSV
jgi:hypothetical protein